MWDPSSPTRNQGHSPCVGCSELEPLEVPSSFFFFLIFIYLTVPVLVVALRIFDQGSSSLTRDRTWAPCIENSRVLATGPPGSPYFWYSCCSGTRLATGEGQQREPIFHKQTSPPPTSSHLTLRAPTHPQAHVPSQTSHPALCPADSSQQPWSSPTAGPGQLLNVLHGKHGPQLQLWSRFCSHLLDVCL